MGDGLSDLPIRPHPYEEGGCFLEHTRVLYDNEVEGTD